MATPTWLGKDKGLISHQDALRNIGKKFMVYSRYQQPKIETEDGKMKYGQCKLCQLENPLNFEHFPPRSAFNKSTRYISVPSEIYTSLDKPLKPPHKGKVRQGGTGYHAFCEECNNFLGLNYVKAYEHWAKIGSTVLRSTSMESNYYEFIAKNIEPKKFSKR